MMDDDDKRKNQGHDPQERGGAPGTRRHDPQERGGAPGSEDEREEDDAMTMSM